MENSRWGVAYEKALRDARANLLEISGEPFESPQPGLYVSPWRDNHDASRLLLTNRIRRLDVKGDHVAMVPNRDTLLVTGSADFAGLARMAEIATAAMDEPYWVSGLPVRLTDGGWARFMPDAEHPSFRDFKSLRTRSIGVDYGEQDERNRSGLLFDTLFYIAGMEPTAILAAHLRFDRGGAILRTHPEREVHNLLVVILEQRRGIGAHQQVTEFHDEFRALILVRLTPITTQHRTRHGAEIEVRQHMLIHHGIKLLVVLVVGVLVGLEQHQNLVGRLARQLVRQCLGARRERREHQDRHGEKKSFHGCSSMALFRENAIWPRHLPWPC